MIIMEIIGGLGNQMFQYALGRHLSIINKTDLYLDISNFDKYHLRKFELDKFRIKAKISPVSLTKKYRTNKLLSKIGFTKKTDIFEFNNNLFQEKIANLRGSYYLRGYWQTEKYFYDHRLELLDELTLQEQYDLPVKGLIDEIEQTNSVSIHVRRGDYVSNPKVAARIGSLDSSYYQKAFEYIKKRIDNPRLFVFSDDIAWCKKNLNLSAEVTFMEPGKSYHDMILMSKCKHNIIANSSFSWWGAWLNKNPDKIVVAPKMWYKIKINNDIVPNRWKTI